ncbi:MAG: hypothetical protein Q4P78_00555 [Rothia sp. (in: high G+C Gram-positive bacteria)]|uniref:hypothetical protein n=1 Tax=Rothia sp. (in: high G+C Gram-positive bacteria) TaxID=1885016 RepID=UPI0026DECEEE|nr:hypothetical protein [Rothia sp. (in: high G+C Gram-positive bacteria)]MDO5749680.1 hypothetical protein [Rothia sp. (in: high G+C Gram-positive bacteria)]
MVAFSWSRLLSAGLLVMALSACGSSNSSHYELPNPEPLKEVAAEPIEGTAYIDSVNELFRIPDSVNKAMYRVTLDCMVQRGFPARSLYPFPHNQSLGVGEGFTVEVAREHGYAYPKQANQPTEEDFAGIPDEELRALHTRLDQSGEVAGSEGCLNIAQSKVIGSDDDYRVLFYSQKNLLGYTNGTTFDARLSAKEEEWAVCMQDRFHRNASEGMTLYVIEAEKAENSHELAIEDATCRETVGYSTYYRDVMNGYMKQFLDDNQGLVENVTQVKKKADERAVNILNSIS